MQILIAGATGAAGKALIPLLIEHGYTVTGTTRSPNKFALLEALGATPAVMDGLDPKSVKATVEKARPDVIVHQMTSISGVNMRSIDKTFATTNRLRTEGTEHLIAAAPPNTRLVVQSFGGWPYARTGGPVKSERDPLDADPPKGTVATLAAIKRLEQLTTNAGGIVLRYGGFYGPGTGMARDGEQAEMIRKRRFPIVGGGEGIWSFLHMDDLAAATLAAIERGKPGEIYNVSDDDPAPVKEWLPYFAQALGAPPPRRIPAFIARLIAGPAAVAMMTESRGASNAKAKAELGWTPRHPTWREAI
jgi:nucleoside-diphosphate-sugar epimerase